MSPHNIDYKELPLYKKLIELGLEETTGKIQAKKGTIRFKSYEIARKNPRSGYKTYYNYIWYIHGKLSKAVNGQNQYIAYLPKIEERTKDYNKAFQAIKNKLEGKRRAATKWYEQMYQAKERVFDLSFNNSKVLEILKNPENDWYAVKKLSIDKWNKNDGAKQLHWILKEFSFIKKSRDYE